MTDKIQDGGPAATEVTEDELFSISPDTTLREFVSFVVQQLMFKDRDAFDFTIDAFGPAGPVEIHFEATMRPVKDDLPKRNRGES